MNGSVQRTPVVRRSPEHASELRRLDEQVRQKTNEALSHFYRHRLPGVPYDMSSQVDAKGALVITWTPRGPQ